MYEVKKKVKKQENPVLLKIKKAIGDIAENLYLGDPLKGHLSHIRKWVQKDHGILLL